jgi:hypothetical protein
LNEEKREIKLIKPEFVPQIEKEFKKVIKSWVYLFKNLLSSK